MIDAIRNGYIYRHGNRGGETTFDSAAALRLAKPTSEWQTFEIEVVGETLNVTLNGTVVTRATGLANRRGFIGLQGEAGIVEYRAIQIQELPWGRNFEIGRTGSSNRKPPGSGQFV